METGGRHAEVELVRRAKAGEEEAFRILLERYVPELRDRIAGWLPDAVNRKVSVADVLQDAHLVAFQRFGDFEHRGENSLRNWLLRIAQMKSREAVRRHVGTAKRAATREVSRPHRLETGQYPGRGPSPSQKAMAAELAAQVRAALEQLPGDDRRVLVLTCEEGLTLREAATRMERPYESVRKLYGRAVGRFSQVLARLRVKP